MAEVKHCYRHPDRETRVTCATCGRPICTECMRQSEVGIKCPDDAQLPRGARAGVMKSNQIVRTLLVGALVALSGIPVVFLIFRIGFLSLILSAIAGYAAGRIIYRAGGYNGGPVAMTVAGVAVAIPFVFFMVPGLLAGAFNPFLILPLGIAAGFAIYQSSGR